MNVETQLQDALDKAYKEFQKNISDINNEMDSETTNYITEVEKKVEEFRIDI